jgi:hypothetical protein
VAAEAVRRPMPERRINLPLRDAGYKQSQYFLSVMFCIWRINYMRDVAALVDDESDPSAMPTKRFGG